MTNTTATHDRPTPPPPRTTVQSIADGVAALRHSEARWTGLLMLTILAILACWQLAVTSLGLISEAFLPPPTAVASAFMDLMVTGEFWSAFFASVQALLIGVAIAVVLGVVIGAAVGWFPLLRFAVAPFLWFLYSTPKVALAPIFILMLGLGNTSKIALTIMLAIFPILLNTMEGVQTVNPSIVRAGRVFGFRGLAMGRKIIVPATLPYSLAGIQRGAVLGFTGTVLGEFLGGAGGLGHMLQRAAFDFQMDEALAIVVVMVIIANTLLLSVAVIRRRLAPWYDADVAG